MKLEQLVSWSVTGDRIRLEMLDGDGQLQHLDVSGACAGVLVAALAAELQRVGGEGKDQQFIRPTGMQTARTGGGEPVVLMSLNGGVELPLVFKPESLRTLINELTGLLGVLEPDTQVRWR